MPNTESRRATKEELRALDNAQFNEFGAVVAGSGLNATHLANGLVQTLLALPELCRTPPPWSETEDVSSRERFQEAVRSAVASLGIPAQPLSVAARAMCVTRTKEGPTSLVEKAPQPSKYAAMVEAGRAHVRRHFVAEQGSVPSLNEEQHELIARALNADGKVMGAGGHAPTTPGVALLGFDSNYTLFTMIPGTFLSLLARSSVGQDCIRSLYEYVWDKKDTHSLLVSWLELDADLPPPAGANLTNAQAALPFPNGDQEDWGNLAERVGAMTSRLLSWSGPSLGKLDLLMSLVDLIGLIFLLRGLGPRPGRPRSLLLVGVEAPREVDRVATKLAKDTMRSAGLRLEQLVESRHLSALGPLVLGPAFSEPATRKAPLPSHFRRIAQRTRWLYPTGGSGGQSRGQVQHYLCPGVRQLSTLTRALVGRDELLTWPEFHERALGLGVVLGGAQEQEADLALGIPGARSGLQIAGRANQRVLIDLGLAYRESDNVVLVTGGS